MRTPGCFYLIVHPLDTQWELETKVLELKRDKSQISAQAALSKAEKQRLDDLLEQYAYCFQPRKDPPAERVPWENFSIPLEPQAKLQFTQCYRLSPTEREELRKLLAEYVDAGKMDVCAGSA